MYISPPPVVINGDIHAPDIVSVDGGTYVWLKPGHHWRVEAADDSHGVCGTGPLASTAVQTHKGTYLVPANYGHGYALSPVDPATGLADQRSHVRAVFIGGSVSNRGDVPLKITVYCGT